ncbi:hypothetical protein SASPL_142358 [Salvia splendens]|uniref:Dof zinc finger protein n=1 Tax=Salvia splendens TaxID=180675 RepID=A0A8X8WKR9_SALSN|nr:dof zinc finger protein DOF5.7-like [Salvia splendens]KAG6396214.1 hypothetical protein SASPL_142358 [Salvia splendens]
MIQELLGGSSVGLIGERSKLSTTPCGDGAASQSPSPSPSPSSSSSATNAAAPPENLRCPRCDSANTKFCYYNNYNLTQPRHFCKTCRRYWTKGGALRNVPIGGGCRKNKNTTITTPVAAKSAAAKFKTTPPSELSKNHLFGAAFDHGEALSSNPLIWPSSQNSHFLSLIRANQQTLNLSHLAIKDETPLFGSSHLSSGPDHLGPAHFPSTGMPNSLYRSQTLATPGILHGEAQNTGLQELYHRLRLSSNCYPEHAPVINGNMSSANSSAILESAPVTEMGFWSSWPADLQTTNGAYP